MMMKKSISALALLLSVSNLFPYTYTFYNATKAPVWIDPFWNRLSLAEEQMFEGTKGKVVAFDPNQLDWSAISANRLEGPIQLLPNKKYTFKFNEWWNIGLCIRLIKLGWSKDTILEAPMKMAQMPYEFEDVMEAANAFTGNASSTAATDKEKAVGSTPNGSGKEAEKLIRKLPSSVGIGRCNSLNILIGTDNNGKLTSVVQPRQNAKQ